MAGEFSDEVGVFYFLVEVADEGTAGHVGAGYVTNGVLLGGSGLWIDCGDHAVDTGFMQPFPDGGVKLPVTHTGEEVLRIFALVALHNLNGGGGQIDLDGALAVFLGLLRNVLYGESVGALDDVFRSEVEQVADTAADVALEDEYVAGKSKLFVIQLCFVIDVSFLGGEVVGRAIILGACGVLFEGIVGGVTHVQQPVPVGTDSLHIIDDGILAPSKRGATVDGVRPGVFVARNRLEFAVKVFSGDGEEGMFGAHELFDSGEIFRGHGVQHQAFAGVHLVSIDNLEDDAVVFLSLF